MNGSQVMLAMGIDIQDEDAVAGFAVSRKALGLDGGRNDIPAW